MYIKQTQIRNMDTFLKRGKVLVILGPRRIGKTTLIEHFIKSIKEPYLFVNGEDIIIQQQLSSQSINKLKQFVGRKRMLIIDEAQAIPNIGLNLKLIVDHVPDIKIIATGSSSFDLSSRLGEPLTGRKYSLKLYPLAQMELTQIEEPHHTIANLDERLLYGSYPEIVLMEDNSLREVYLKELIAAYLFKDILQYDNIRHSGKLTRLLQLLAFQIGKNVSHSELGQQLEMSKNTVERYLDLLEKVFVIVKLTGFKRNLRKEISKSNRYYFMDLGVRNALIGNFNPLDLRDDIGALWENYLILERMKKNEYRREWVNTHFWRTYDGEEIDLVEDKKGKLYGYEMKWSKKKVKPPPGWLKHYSNSSWKIIHRENYLDFIT